MDKRDRFEEIFRDRLYNLEYNPDQDGQILLPVLLPRRRSYAGRIAAAVALLLLAGGCWLFIRNPEAHSPETIRVSEMIIPVPADTLNAIPNPERTVFPDFLIPAVTKKEKYIPSSPLLRAESVPLSKPVKTTIPALLPPTTDWSLPKPQQQQMSSFRLRKWRIGIGSSSLSMASLSSNGIGGTPDFNFNDNVNHPGKPEDPDRIPPSTRTKTVPLYTPRGNTKIKHLMPVAFGISLSRSLNDRWSLQTGVSYTYLYSKWKYEYGGSIAQRQHLHLLGIPLGVSCRLTDWQLPYCYFSAGVLAEVNVCGCIRNSYGKYHIRIPGVLWTTHAKVGLAYPLVRFIAVYAEGGLCYYFDYKGNIATIRSRNDFNLSGQIGIRLNF